MEQFYSPSMNDNRGFAAMNTKGEPVYAVFSPERAYTIDWKFGPRRGVILDDYGNKIVVVNNARGDIFTDIVGESAQPAVNFAPTLYKHGDKAPRKICNDNEDLFLLINSQIKEVDGYSVAKLDVANLSSKSGPAQSVHFIVYQNGVIVDALYDMKTDLQLIRRLTERGADVAQCGAQVFTKKTKEVKSFDFLLNKHSISFKTAPNMPVTVLDQGEVISECSTWLEALSVVYQLSQTKSEFDELVLPLMAKSRQGLIAKTLGVSAFAGIH